MKERKEEHPSLTAFIRSMQLPEDYAKGNIVVTMQGQEHVIIENFKGISCCTPEEIRLITRKKRICIAGKRLTIENYSKEEMEISGLIEKIEYY